jgi:predicted NAD/FAD-binding protein
VTDPDQLKARVSRMSQDQLMAALRALIDADPEAAATAMNRAIYEHPVYPPPA